MLRPGPQPPSPQPPGPPPQLHPRRPPGLRNLTTAPRPGTPAHHPMSRADERASRTFRRARGCCPGDPGPASVRPAEEAMSPVCPATVRPGRQAPAHSDLSADSCRDRGLAAPCLQCDALCAASWRWPHTMDPAARGQAFGDDDGSATCGARAHDPPSSRTRRRELEGKGWSAMSDRQGVLPRHRFTETYPYLLEGVRWNLVGDRQVVGREDVMDTCRQSAEYLRPVARRRERRI